MCGITAQIYQMRRVYNVLYLYYIPSFGLGSSCGWFSDSVGEMSQMKQIVHREDE